MASHDFLEPFRNLDIKNYLDASLQSHELAYLKNELYKHEKIENEINEKLFKTFLLNIDSLIDILEKSHEINKRVLEIKGLIFEYKKIFKYFESSDESEQYVDKEKRQRFKDLMENFDGEAQIFVTKNRILLCSEFFTDRESNEYILVFTNDLLIVGLKANKQSIQTFDEKSHKSLRNKRNENEKDFYSLKNAFNYNVLEIKGENENLIVKIDPISYIFKSSKKVVKSACKIFNENKYKQNKSNKGNKDYEESSSEDFTNEIVEFYIKTEQYDRLQEYKGKFNFVFEVEDVKFDKNVLFLLLDLLNEDERKRFFCKYLDYLFGKKIDSVNIIQDLKNYIKDVFNVFKDFYRVAKDLFEEYWHRFKVEKIERANFVVYIESAIIRIFTILRKRIFGRKGTIEETESFLESLNLHLKIDGYDFTYLYEFFEEDKHKRNTASVNVEKLNIDKVLDEMLANDK